ISITDGQIFLETDLFNQGKRPAINVGISVSRVGGNAQIKPMKKVSGTLKMDQAQYQELAAFTKFGGDMDKVTAMTIDKGKKNEQLLIQPLHQPMSVEKQVAVLYCGTEGLLRDIPVEKVSEFEKQFLFTLDVNHKETVLDRLKNSEFNDEITAILRKVAADTVKQLQN
ncbi:MAG TPA: F0F1 ATP synthase subunit alpha, partial [Porphyromonadaceae bacterium]|nr:F0F1 ATP synthase subunit alpha [Porphyromonadaceae bacterium]